MKKPELLAPAGDFEKLKYALEYGADAVYAGLKDLNLRVHSKNFSIEELKEAIEYTHKKGKKIYLTLNIFAHNEHLTKVKKLLPILKRLDLDGIIVSDPGILEIIRENLSVSIHLSTQANTLNYLSANFWQKMGVKRIIFARELSYTELKQIRESFSGEMEIFVHGAMCTAYSGRCYLSEYFTGRNANLGDCAHPCRWEYYVVEKTRRGEYIPIIETSEGTTFFSSKDLCLLPFLDKLIELGIDAFKIEGRMKTLFYLCKAIKAYRNAIDEYFSSKKISIDSYMQHLEDISHREYSYGFLFEIDTHQQYTRPAYKQEALFLGKIIKEIEKNKYYVSVKNRMKKGEEINFITPFLEGKTRVLSIERNKNFFEIAHPGLDYIIEFDKNIGTNFILLYRRKEKENEKN